MRHTTQSLIVVEDEPLIGLMIEELVQDLGWRVDGIATTQLGGLALLADSSPKLALLDINLGQTTSLEVASSCRERRIPVVFMTGYTAKDVPLQCGDAPVLAKPFSPEELEQAIRRAMASEHA